MKKLNPYNIAVGMIKPYVDRGDTIQDLKEGRMGIGLSEYSAHIGGYASGKKYSSDNIIVNIDGKNFIFKLEKIFNDIKSNQKTLL